MSERPHWEVDRKVSLTQIFAVVSMCSGLLAFGVRQEVRITYAEETTRRIDQSLIAMNAQVVEANIRLYRMEGQLESVRAAKGPQK